MASSSIGIFKPHSSGLPPSKETPTIIFLSGFPDLPESWSRLASLFESTHHVVTMAMPDYGEPKLMKFWGYSIDEMVLGLAVAIEPHHKRGSPVYLVGHDWGAWIALRFVDSEFCHLISKLVLLDVGLRKNIDWVALSYMSYLALAFLVSRISDILARIMIVCYPWQFIGPCPYETSTPIIAKKCRGFFTYPYFQILFEKKKMSFAKNVPQLYLYGGRKRIMFHDQDFLDMLDNVPHSRHKQFLDSAHYLHWTIPDSVAAEIKSFIS